VALVVFSAPTVARNQRRTKMSVDLSVHGCKAIKAVTKSTAGGMALLELTFTGAEEFELTVFATKYLPHSTLSLIAKAINEAQHISDDPL